MSKKNKSAAKKTKQGHPARSAEAAKIISIDEFRARNSGDELVTSFAKWIRSNSSLNVLGDPVPALQNFLSVYSESGAVNHSTSLSPSSLVPALSRMQEDHSTADFEFILHVVLGYALFLSATERWNASEEQFDAVQEVIMDFVDEAADDEFDDRVLVVPALDQNTTYQALNKLSLAQRLSAFMQWFGAKRDITSKGVLTRKDIEGAAAALDVSAIGVASNATPPGVEPEGPLRVYSAVDVQRLDLYWEALTALGVIELSATKAILHDPLAGLEGTEHEVVSIALLRDLALVIYTRFCNLGQPLDEEFVELDDEEDFDGSSTGELIGALLLEAAHEDGYPVEDLRMVTQTLAGDDQLEIMAAEAAMEIMAAEGLIDIGENYAIPPVFKKTIAFLLAEPEECEIEYEDPADEDIEYAGAH